MHKNTIALRRVMKRNKLSCGEVATLTGRQAGTVRVWRCKDDRRVIPDEILRLVVLEMEQRQARAATK